MRWCLLAVAMLVCASSAFLHTQESAFLLLGNAQPRDGASNTSGPTDDDDFDLPIKDGVDLGNTLLTITGWPLMVGLSLVNTFLGVVGAVITGFTFLAGFVNGGAGANLLAWLKADPPSAR